MGKLVAIEGIDGSGKKTQTARLAEAARAKGMSVEVFSFPRYAKSVFAGSIAEYLNGRFGGLRETPPEFAALLYAGDRLEARDELLAALETHDLVLCDRYVASNLAHQSARLTPEDNRNGFQSWISSIEFQVYGLPFPSATVFLDIPVEVAVDLIEARARRTYTNQIKDLHEEDLRYLHSCRAEYLALAHSEWVGEWISIPCAGPDGALLDAQEIHSSIWTALVDHGVIA